MFGESMLERIRKNAAVADVLAGFEFDVSRTDPVEDVRLASGVGLETVSGDAAGGSYFLCGKGRRRPVLYATSEGQAGLIGTDLRAVLELLIGVPYWMDCLKFSGGGSLEEMRAAEARLGLGLAEDFPDLEADRALLRSVLDLGESSVGELVARLHAAVAGTVPDFVLLDPKGNEYASLFNTFRVSESHWLQDADPA